MKGILLLIFMLFLSGTVSSFAQTQTISGRVVSAEDKEPVPGVSVSVKGTTLGTVTDISGAYEIIVPQGAETLVFSFVGMLTTEKNISGTVVDLVMQPDFVGVDEILVMGYARHGRSEVTGSAVQIQGGDLADMPVVSIDQALQGRVAGVAVSSASGTPGSVQSIRVRGVSSITAGNQPLYVIDGVPMVNTDVSTATAGSSLSSLASLNSNDIESITVLKDASATAAYGARGANGVIVIATKSGRSGKAAINFNASYGFSNDAVKGPGVLTGAQREMLFYEAIYNTYGKTEGFAPSGAQEFYEANPAAFGTDYVQWNAAGRPETYWPDIITNKNAPMQEYDLSASGGGEGYNYYTSIAYFDQEATVIGSEFQRISGALNLGIDIRKNLRFSARNNASHSYQDGLLENSAYFSAPRAVKYFMPSIDQPYNTDGSINYDKTSLPNPLWIAQEDIDDSKLTRILSNNSLEWKTPLENLSFTSRVTIDYHVYNYKRYRNPVRGDGGGETKGYGWQANRNRANYVFQNFADYSIQLNGGHGLDFKVLQEFQKNRLYYLEADADNFSSVGLTNLNSAGNPTTANSWFTDWALASYLGMVHYSFEGKYIADATYRREGSSLFSSDNRWGDFWSLGAAWNMHRENFMQTAEAVVSNLKIRASYGVTGNSNITLNQYQGLLNYDADYAGEGASYPGTSGNEDLSWETAHTLDVGLGFGLFENRVFGSLAYYRRESRNLLLDVPLSLTTGFTQQTRNIGRMENKGFELEINFDIIRSKDLNIGLGGNLATNQNEVLELAKDVNGDEINITSTTTRVESKHPVYEWYMPAWAGVDPHTGNELWYVDGERTETTENFNSAKQVWQGASAIPIVIAGMSLHFDYKGFFLDANAYYAGGHKVYEEWNRYTNATDVFSVAYYQGVDALLDRWQKPGDQTRFGKFEYTSRPWRSHSKFLYDGDYLRLKDLALGYDFGHKITESVNVGGIRVFVRGINIYTWVKDENLKYDPEVGTDGMTNMSTPPAKSFVFGVNLKF